MNLRRNPFILSVTLFIVLWIFPGLFCSWFSGFFMWFDRPFLEQVIMMFVFVIGPYVMLASLFLLFTKPPQLHNNWIDIDGQFAIYRVMIFVLLLITIMMMIGTMEWAQRVINLPPDFESQASGMDLPTVPSFFANWLLGLFSGLLFMFYRRFALLRRQRDKQFRA